MLQWQFLNTASEAFQLPNWPIAKGGMICLDTMADQSGGENRPQSLKDDKPLIFAPKTLSLMPRKPLLLHNFCIYNL